MTITSDTNIKGSKVNVSQDTLRRAEESLWTEINKNAELKSKEIDRLEHTIYGNGQDGLITDVRVLKTMVDLIQQNEEKRTRREWAIIVAVFAMVAESMLGFMG